MTDPVSTYLRTLQLAWNAKTGKDEGDPFRNPDAYDGNLTRCLCAMTPEQREWIRVKTLQLLPKCGDTETVAEIGERLDKLWEHVFPHSTYCGSMVLGPLANRVTGVAEAVLSLRERVAALEISTFGDRTAPTIVDTPKRSDAEIAIAFLDHVKATVEKISFRNWVVRHASGEHSHDSLVSATRSLANSLGYNPDAMPEHWRE